MGKIKDIALKVGAENIIFFMPARPVGMSWDDFHKIDVVQEIKAFRAVEDERPNRIVAEGYKVFLRCSDPKYCDEEFYQMDFESFMQEQPARFFITSAIGVLVL